MPTGCLLPMPQTSRPRPGAASTELSTRVNDALAAFLDRAEPVVTPASAPSCARRPRPPREFVLAGGKRLRPAFCYWGWRGTGAADSDGVAQRPPLSLELLHACALIHDDVMDALRHPARPSGHPPPVRRAAPRRAAGEATQKLSGRAPPSCSATSAWSGPTRCSASAGSSRPRSTGARGDLLRDAGRADGGPVPRRAGVGAARAGQRDWRPGGPLRVARYKSAKYTIERPLQLGGTLAGAPAALLAAYSAYGLPLGEAFQLRDDVLGVFGDPAVTGKPAGDDLREGKRTVARDAGRAARRIRRRRPQLQSPARQSRSRRGGRRDVPDDHQRMRSACRGRGINRPSRGTGTGSPARTRASTTRARRSLEALAEAVTDRIG